MIHWQGELRDIFLLRGRGEPLEHVDEVRAVAGRGLDGDRRRRPDDADPRDPDHDPGREVTLVELEAVRAVADGFDPPLRPEEIRRNLLVAGVPLNHLVGCRFRVGDEVVLEGIRLCEPCPRLERLTRPGVREALLHRAGLRAAVRTTGTIRRGDEVRPLGDDAAGDLA